MSVTQDEMIKGYRRPSFWQSLNAVDWLWAVTVLAGGAWLFMQYGSAMDGYEHAILSGTVLTLAVSGWLWKPVRVLGVCVALLTLFALSRYGDVLAASESDFFLKFLFASQSAIMWMSALYVMATIAYFGQLFSGINP